MASIYLLNGKNLSTYGIIPGQAPSSNIAFSGAWDMPSRTGKTHHVWSENEGIEPYVLPDEIFFGGRDLSFHFHLKAIDRQNAISRLYDLYADINSFTGLVPFASDLYGTYMIAIKDEIKVNYVGSGICSGVITMREPAVNLTGTIPLADNISPGIDGRSFKSLGWEVATSDGQFNRASEKGYNLTSYQTERYKKRLPSARTLSVELVGAFGSYPSFINAIRTLYAMLAAPYARTIVRNGISREVFAKDGFKVNLLYKNGNTYTCRLKIDFTEIRLSSNYDLFVDEAGSILTDNENTPITLILNSN